MFSENEAARFIPEVKTVSPISLVEKKQCYYCGDVTVALVVSCNHCPQTITWVWNLSSYLSAVLEDTELWFGITALLQSSVLSLLKRYLVTILLVIHWVELFVYIVTKDSNNVRSQRNTYFFILKYKLVCEHFCLLHTATPKIPTLLRSFFGFDWETPRSRSCILHPFYLDSQDLYRLLCQVWMLHVNPQNRYIGKVHFCKTADKFKQKVAALHFPRFSCKFTTMLCLCSG